MSNIDMSNKLSEVHLQQKAENNAKAALELGLQYEKGEKVAANLSKAQRHYQKIKLVSCAGNFYLSYCYMHGIGKDDVIGRVLRDKVALDCRLTNTDEMRDMTKAEI